MHTANGQATLAAVALAQECDGREKKKQFFSEQSTSRDPDSVRESRNDKSLLIIIITRSLPLRNRGAGVRPVHYRSMFNAVSRKDCSMPHHTL